MFDPVEGNVNFPELEGRIGRFWRERGIYEKSLERREGAPSFVFYEGPPTANGMPHPGHCLTRAIKDLFPRYRTMRGYRCERKAGWDTHGLPVEVEVCKELGIHSKEEIENYGIERFIIKCQQSVWRYMKEWERLTERLGFWIHLDEAYVTYHQSYVESVWWALKNFFDRGLLYRGHKIVWWWAQGGTALSAGEVGQGYREVADPSVYVRFPLLDDDGKETDTSLLVWTTTPWTLPSNQFVAVNPTLDYAYVRDKDSGEKLVIAWKLQETIEKKKKCKFDFIKSVKGRDLFGKRYRPPFDCYYRESGDKRATFRTDRQGKATREQYYWNDLRLNNQDGAQATVDSLMAKDEDVVAWRVVPAGFVTLDSGTGIVHQAPAFGEVDFDVLLRQQSLFEKGEGPELLCPVAPNGNFTEKGPEYCHDRWVLDCNKDLSRDMKARGLLFHQEQYLHEYPFCWRAEEDPLIQYPRESWFIRTKQFKDQMLENNAKINWLPEHIKDGRFGNFLESNVDWSLSRERYWGTPLPIWVCQETGQMEAIGKYDELLAKPGIEGTEVWEQAKAKRPELPEDLKVHKPYIDAVTYDSPFAEGARMRRVTEVIDCWFDSGAMPFAQWGYPHVPGSQQRFESQFPADFISEALDQTRGWFYGQLAISTLLFGEETALGGSRGSGEGDAATDDVEPQIPNPKSQIPNPKATVPQPPASAEGCSSHNLKSEICNLKSEFPFPHPFRNCIVLGLMLGEDGQKMSKSKRNYLAPDEIFDRYGADALRWYFFANQPPWTSVRYSEQAIKESIPEFLLRLWNCYSFFVIYANIDGFDPGAEIAGEVEQLNAGDFAAAKTYRAVAERRELDRWIIGELHQTTATVTERMDAYDNFGACGQIIEFVDALSNWYLRRSRDRYWSSDKQDPDKLDAYWTLYECLVTTTKLIAPFVPHVADALWQNLAVTPFGERTLESVHLCDYPTADTSLIDRELSEQSVVVREIASLGRAARMGAGLKVRQPLAKVLVVLADAAHQAWLESHAPLIAEELNVKSVEFPQQADQYITYQVQPNFKRLGPRVGKLIPAVKKALAEVDGGELLAQLKADGKVSITVEGETIELDNEDIQVRLQAKAGWAASQGSHCVVVLATELTEELIQEGIARDLVRIIQDRRKEMNCDFTDHIAIGIDIDSKSIGAAIANHEQYIKAETLAERIVQGPLDDVVSAEFKLSDEVGNLYVKVVLDE
ncbi:MAG: isoleucine--tRNA ligase [Planctomycetes bacterium]|nr:isoleucine--tRNA ligase [Planctomycetota bacterium]